MDRYRLCPYHIPVKEITMSIIHQMIWKFKYPRWFDIKIEIRREANRRLSELQRRYPRDDDTESTGIIDKLDRKSSSLRKMTTTFRTRFKWTIDRKKLQHTWDHKFGKDRVTEKSYWRNKYFSTDKTGQFDVVHDWNWDFVLTELQSGAHNDELKMSCLWRRLRTDEQIK